MKIDADYLNTTANLVNEQQRVRGTRHQMDPQAGLNSEQVQQGGATARVSATIGVSRTARPSNEAEVSGVTHSISDMAAVVNFSADVRQARVDALRDAISQGTYQVSPERIAESMLMQATSRQR